MFEKKTAEQPTKTFADVIESIAASAGLKVEKRSDMLAVAHFDLGEGRSQQVFIRPIGKEGDKLIIGFFSPALKMPADQALGQKTANDLLRQNASLPHGAWAIEKVDNDEYLVVFDTQIAQTMDPEEFKASAVALAITADGMEKKLGVDSF